MPKSGNQGTKTAKSHPIIAIRTNPAAGRYQQTPKATVL
jgi:hypothetical protein